MTALTDELVRRRLSDRAAEAPAISLAAIARSVSAQPRPRSAPLGLRSAFVAPIMALLVVALAIAGGLLSRGSPTPGSSGSVPARSGTASSQPSSPQPGSAAAAWTELTWKKVSAEAFASDETIVDDAIAVGDGFVAVGTTTSGGVRTGRVWRSDDGRTWERIDDPGIATMDPVRILSVGSTVVALGLERTPDDRSKQLQVWRSTDGRSWVKGPTLPAPADPMPAAASPAGILLPVGHDTWLLGPDLSSWTLTTTWPADVYLGTPAWADGRWLQPGATGVLGANVPTTAAIWTSADGTSWDPAPIDASAGAAFSIQVADHGLLAVGQSANLCLLCRGPLIQPSTTWASDDGREWQRVGGPALLAGSGSRGRFVGDRRRIIGIGPFVVSLGQPGIPGPSRVSLSETLDGLTWMEIAQAGPTPADDIGNAFVVVGAQGVAILPRQNGGGSGASDAVPWWGDATPPGPTSPTNSPGPAPSVDPLAAVSGCDTLGFDARRCDAVVVRARERAHPPLRAEEVTAATVTRPIRDSTTLGSFPIASITFDLVGGGTTTVDVRCGLPSASDRVCNADPQVTLYGGVAHDVPCGATPGDENHPCATLPQTPRRASVAAAEPLILRVFDVPLDHVGHYDVLVGAASLPDGLLSERSGTLADSRPTSWWIDGGVSIVVRPGKPCVGNRCPSIESIYHEPFRGPQPVNVYLVFDVSELDVVGSILEVRTLIVR